MEVKIQSFINYLFHQKNYSLHTVKAYEADLKSFAAFLEIHFDIHTFSEVKRNIVRSYVVDLLETGSMPATISRKISSIKSLYKYLKIQGFDIVDPTIEIVLPKKNKKLPVYVSESEMKDLYNPAFFSGGEKGVLEQVIILLIYSTGIRLSELIELKLVNYDAVNNRIKVLGKRRKERIVPLNDKVKELLDMYIAQVRIREGESNEQIFVTVKGKKLYPKFVYRLVNNYLGKVSTITKKSPHVLRHTFATHMLNNGADLNTIKELLGHAGLAATQVYTHNSVEKLKNVYQQAHPRGG